MSKTSNSRAISASRQLVATSLLWALAACADADKAADKVIEATPLAATPALARLPTVQPSSLQVCRMQVTNAPLHDPNSRLVADFRPVLTAGGDVPLLIVPVRDACLSSGYGWRDGRMHDGLDFFSRRSPAILAAGDGRVVIKAYHRDFGNMIVLDHGSQIYTLYAHLASFADGLKVSDTVTAGANLGIMGATGRGIRAPHLHYEILRGDLGTESVFLMESLDPFAQPGGRGEKLIALR